MDLSTGSGKGPLCVARVLVLIHQDFNQPLRVADMARHGGLSPFHFSRVFRKAVGQAPHEYLTARRVKFARELLEHTDFTAREIGKRTGYSRQAHFTQIFREMTGMTPGAYRLQMRTARRVAQQ